MAGERRRSQRTPLIENLELKRLDDGSGETIRIDVSDQIGGESVPLDVSDLSSGGIGFNGSMILQISSIFETDIVIWTQEKIHAFLEIVRIEKVDDKHYYYGASFVGMPEMDAARISTYQTIERVEKEEREKLLVGMEKPEA